MIKFHNYLPLFLLFCTASLVYAQYIPKPRFAHASILVDSKLYFIGGFDSNGKSQSDFFYLDLSVPFSTEDTNTLKYVQVNNNDLTPNAWCTTATTNNMIYLFGCFMVSGNSSLIYQYNISSNKWEAPSFDATSPSHRISSVVVTDSSTERIYYFGGKDDAYNVLNDTWIFNTSNNQLSWQQITPAPMSICCFPAILLPDGYILYIGGNVFMNNITRYNTKLNYWDYKPTKGVNLLRRSGLSAILVPDGRIIVYGGLPLPQDIATSMPQDDLAVLDTTTYEWVSPVVKDKPDAISFHTVCLYGNYMIVAFGISNNNLKPNSGIYLLNITDKTTYKWITDFNPNISIENGNKPSNHVGIIIGATIGVVSISLLVSFFSYKFYKYRKNNNQRESSKIAVDDFN